MHRQWTPKQLPDVKLTKKIETMLWGIRDLEYCEDYGFDSPEEAFGHSCDEYWCPDVHTRTIDFEVNTPPWTSEAAAHAGMQQVWEWADRQVALMHERLSELMTRITAEGFSVNTIELPLAWEAYGSQLRGTFSGRVIQARGIDLRCNEHVRVFSAPAHGLYAVGTGQFYNHTYDQP